MCKNTYNGLKKEDATANPFSLLYKSLHYEAVCCTSLLGQVCIVCLKNRNDSVKAVVLLKLKKVIL